MQVSTFGCTMSLLYYSYNMLYVRTCRYAELLLLLMFVILILLWLFREPRFIKGWGIIFREENGDRYVRVDVATYSVPCNGFSEFPLIQPPSLIEE